jgi:hypothetical protein
MVVAGLTDEPSFAGHERSALDRESPLIGNRLMSNADARTPAPRNSTRFSPRAIVREGPSSEDVDLLHIFAKQADLPVADRRQSPRSPVVESRAWLGWWATSCRFTSVPACLVDISQGGAKLVLTGPPPAQPIVWLCLGTPGPTECVQAKVLAVVPTSPRDSIIRLAFGTPCPQNLYQVAVFGLSSRRTNRA